MLKIEVDCKNSFREEFYPFSCAQHTIRLTAKTSAPLERTRSFGLETTWKFYYAISALEEQWNT
jgi:hypothetical protein